MEVYKTDSMKIPAKTWSKIENIECGALKQIETACSLPFVFKHIAVMPDCHTGYSCPIGSVIATKNVVVPFFCRGRYWLRNVCSKNSINIY